MFSSQINESSSAAAVGDIEDSAGHKVQSIGLPIARHVKRKRTSPVRQSSATTDAELTQSWKEILGSPPPMGTTKVR